MTTEYEWIEGRDECKREFTIRDMCLGWVIYTVAMFFLFF